MDVRLLFKEGVRVLAIGGVRVLAIGGIKLYERFSLCCTVQESERDLEVRVCLLVYTGRTLFCNDITVTINNRSWLGAPIA